MTRNAFLILDNQKTKLTQKEAKMRHKEKKITEETG